MTKIFNSSIIRRSAFGVRRSAFGVRRSLVLSRYFYLFLIFSLIFPLQSQAAVSIKITSGDADIGTHAVNDKISLKFQASGYVSTDVSKLKWTVKNADGYVNPGFKIAGSGAEVALTAEKLKKVKTNNGTFKVNVSVANKADKTTASTTITGKVMEIPEISTKKLKSYASKGKDGYSYTQPIELKAGSEPITWTLSGDLPGASEGAAGIKFEKITVGKKEVYALHGDTHQAGEYPLEITAKNEVGSHTMKYTLSVIPVKPEIKIPSGVPTEYDFQLNKEIQIDLSKFVITGTKPIALSIDEAARRAGLTLVTNDTERYINVNVKEWAAKKMKVQLYARNMFTESTLGKYKPTKIKLTLNFKEPPSEIVAKAPEYRDFTKNYTASFKATKGTKPITWKFYEKVLDSSNNTTYTPLSVKAKASLNRDILLWEAAEISENGKIKIPKLSSLNYEGYYNYVGSYVAVASNNYGSISYDFTISHGTAPRKVDQKKIKEIILTNGDVAEQLGSDYPKLYDYGYGTIFWDVYKTQAKSTTTSLWNVKLGTLNITGMPSGMSLIANTDFCDYYMNGTLNLSSGFKKYKVKLALENPWGKAKNTLTLDVREPATIDPQSKLVTKNSWRVLLGKKFKLKMPTKIKKPYTWRMTDKNGNTIKGEISISGLAWDPDKGTISGTATKVGAYPVTIWLDNEASETSKDYKIYVMRSIVDIVQEPTGLVFKNDAYDTDEKRSVTATYSSQKYSFNVPLQIVGWPRDRGNVEWEVTGGSNLGVTADLISQTSNSSAFTTYTLKASNLDKNAFERLTNAGTETKTEKVYAGKDEDGNVLYEDVLYWKYSPRTLTLTVKTNNGFEISEGTVGSDTMTATVTFPEPYGWQKGNPPSSSSAPDVGNTFDKNSAGDENRDFEAGDYKLRNLAMRGINDISAKNLALIPNDYEVIAVLPEISVDESGLYEFDVKVSDDIEPDRELKYFAFSSQPDDDDEIVEFYNSDGEEIKTLPENHELTAAAWFNKRKTYEPVIAVKKKE